MGLGAEHHPVRIALAIHLEAGRHVVVPGGVEVRERLVDLVGDDGRLHHLRHDVGEAHRRRVDAGGLVDRPLGERLAEVGEQLGTAHHDSADRLGDEARVVERTHLVGERPSHLVSRRRGSVGDLVADRVEDDTRMVDVVAHHRLDVGLPPLGEPQPVVVAGLGLVPHVERLVHDDHPEPVAGVEHRVAHRVVGAADRVEAGGLEQLDPTLVGTIDRRRTERAVVVVDARAAEIDRARR